jgi:acyl-CoA dehydrogenase
MTSTPTEADRSQPAFPPVDLDESARLVVQVAADHAEEVHRDGRFPIEAIRALRSTDLLGALVPTSLGGRGATVTDMVDITRRLAQECANTAMVFAMHQIQVAMLVRHGDTPELHTFLGELAGHQLLVANAFSEMGIGGDARRSSCAMKSTDAGYLIEKQASVASYALHADAVLLSARRDDDAQPEDQVFVLSRPPDLTLEPLGEWDAIGLRGTDSRPFRMVATGPAGYVLPVPGNDVLGGTGVAVNNLFQSAVWLGIAEAAASRAHIYLKSKRDTDPANPAPLRLAELAAPLQQLRDTMEHGCGLADAVFSGRQEGDARTALTMNTLKVSTSGLALEVVQGALLICGIDGYRNGTPYSLGRHLGDVYAGMLMVNNDRVLLNSGQILKVLRRI